MNKLLTVLLVTGVVVAVATALMRRGIGSGGLVDAGELIA